VGSNVHHSNQLSFKESVQLDELNHNNQEPDGCS
jgi:hypothetical protein